VCSKYFAYNDLSNAVTKAQKNGMIWIKSASTS
jgi:hypothetical protein